MECEYYYITITISLIGPIENGFQKNSCAVNSNKVVYEGDGGKESVIKYILEFFLRNRFSTFSFFVCPIFFKKQREREAAFNKRFGRRRKCKCEKRGK